MEAIQISVLKKAIKLLDVLDIKYILVPVTGEPIVRGDIQLAKPVKKKERKKRRPSGTFSNYFKEIGVDQLQPGDVACVPLKEFKKPELQSALSAYASTKWGNGSYTTHYENREIQIMRLL